MTTPPRVHAFSDDALGDFDAVGLAAEIRAGRIGRAEVVEAAIARADKVQPHLGAVAHEDYERARQEAWRKGHGFFAGVPTFFKDNVEVAGLPTQQGSSAFRGRPARADGDLVAAHRPLGLINLGKSQMPEFGISGSAEGPGHTVRNPWNPDYSSGASSAGAAALVASGVVPIAHANDGGGSIRIPAAVCGLVGLKPSRGRVPSDKQNREMPVQVVADGVVVRSVRDAAAHLREIEKVHRNLALRPVGDVTDPSRKRRRIAMVLDSPLARSDDETRAVVLEAAELLESMGHHVEEIPAPVPASFVEDFKVYYGFLFLFLTTTGRRTLDPSFDRRRTEELTRGFAGYAARHLHRLPLAIARLRASQSRSRRVHQQYDAVLTPTLSHVTRRIGHLDPMAPFDQTFPRLLDWVGFTPLQNATGDPAISLPFGMSREGLPIGVQIASGLGNEARLLGLAHEIERARPFPRIQG